MLNAITATSLALSVITAPISSTAPPSDKIVIDVVTVNGSGCPAGAAAVAVAPDNTEFTVTYGGLYTAQVGVGSKPTDFRKNCQLNLRVHVPRDYTYAIAEVDYHGFASLAAGATGSVRVDHHFQGSSGPGPITRTFRGPFADDWQITDKPDESQLVFLPCGEERNLDITTELRVNVGTSDPKTTSSFIAMDSIDGSAGTTYYFAWKYCPAKH